MYEYTGRVIKVVDGDTIDIDVDLGFGIRSKRRIRFLGIDTPEIWRAETPMEKERGKEARDFVKERLLGKIVTFMSHKDKTGKYGRYLGDIVYLGDNREALFITEELKKAGFEKNKY